MTRTARRIRIALAAAATAALLALSLPLPAAAAPAELALARGVAPGPVKSAVSDPQTIVVNVAAIRTGAGPQPLAGVTFELRNSAANSPDSPGAAVGQPWSTCISIANGTCTFTVPNAGTGPGGTAGANNGKRFWVVATGAPEDYYLNPTLITGNNTNTGAERFTQTPYVYRTPPLTGSGTITLPSTTGLPAQSALVSPVNANGSTANRWNTGGKAPVSQANNRFQPTCVAGMKVAILFDLSSSMSTNGNAGLNGAKTAAKTLIDQLVDTGAQVALYTFGTNAPKNNSATGQNYPTLTTVTAGAAATLKANIDLYSASDATNYTNWDRGLMQLADASGVFDLAIVLTDGNPTAYANVSPGAGDDAWTSNRHVEEGIFSANALKNEGTQVLAFGVGDGISQVPGDNLRAISGPAEWTGVGSIANFDYAKTNDWALVASQLKALAAGLTCKVPITVIKTEKALNGSTQLGQGWTFGATKTGDGTLTGAASQVTGPNGQASWSLDFTSTSGVGSVTITETIKSASWVLESVSCTNHGEPFYNGSSLSFTLEGLKVGDNIVCAVTNQQVQASVVVHKSWVVNGVAYANGSQIPSALAAQLKIGGTDQAWGAARSNLTIGGTTTIAETMTPPPALCTVTNQRLNGPGAVNVDVGPGKSFTTPTLQAGQLTYEITNTVICTSSLTLKKEVINDNGGTAQPSDWILFYGATGVASGTTSFVTAGSYELTETGPTGYAPRASNPIVCSSGLSGTSVTVPVGVAVTCTFYNDDIAPTLELQKIVTGAPSVPATNWTLFAKDAAVTVLSGNGGVLATAVKANTPYTLSEAPNDFPGAADFTASLWECQTNGTGPWSTLGVDGVLPGIAPGAHVVCRVTNTPTGVDPVFDKSLTSLVQNPDGTWTITYSVSVTNPSKYSAISYDLADTLQYGGTITKTATATGPSAQAAAWNGVGNTVLADDTALSASSTHTYAVVAVASVPNGAPPQITACPTGDGPGGFLNRAVLTVDGKTYPDTACASPVKPTFSKSPGTATSNADGTWTLTYILTATNSTGVSLYYDLVDDPSADLPTGVEVLGYTVVPPGNGAGTTIADDRLLPAGDSHVYTLTVQLKVGAGVPAAELDCAVQGSGMINSATLTSGNQIITDDACLTLTPPTIIHDKTVTSTSQNPDGSWTIVYDIVVKNTGAVSGLYSLKDDLKVGVPGVITVVSAGAAGVPSWNGVDNQVLATNVAIAPGEANWQHYTITVVATVAAGKTGSPESRCLADGGTNGFLNTAVLTVSGVDTPDSACSTPTKPSPTKTLVESVPAGANTWNVSYLITVDNSAPGALEAYYTLTDLPGFSGELTVTGYTVTETSAEPEVALDWNGGSVIPTPRAIAGGAVDTFLVVITVTVPAGTSTDALECTEAKTPGHGFQNAASIVVGSDTLTAVDCGDVEASAVPTITKEIVDGWPKQLVDGTWEILYDITVTSDSTLDALYSLEDELEYGDGIVVNSAVIMSADAMPDGNWDGEGTTHVVTNQMISGGDMHVYRVTVNASVGQSAYEEFTTACDPELADAGGFLNTATLSVGKTDPQVAADCDSPPLPEVVKSLDAEHPLNYQNGGYRVTYLVTVTNNSSLQLTYGLDDTFAFPVGVALSDWVATGPDGQVIAGWNGQAGVALAAGAIIPKNSQHVYTIAVTATPTSELDLDDLECTGEPGSGLFNAVVLTAGAIDQGDWACDHLPVALLTLVKKVDNSAFEGLDLEGVTLGAASDWELSADGPAVLVGATGSDDVTSVLVPAGEYELAEELAASATNPFVEYYVAGDWDCTGGGLSEGLLTLTDGDDVTCTIVNTGKPVDLTIVKADGGEFEGEPAVPTDEGAGYEYTLTVTNKGSVAAQDVVVTDPIPGTLAVQVGSVVAPPGWTVALSGEDANGFGGTLTLSKTGSFAVGAAAVFTIPVAVADELPRDEEGVILDIVNTAVVDSAGVELTPEDNTSTETTPVKSLQFEVEVTCELNAPYAEWSLTPHNTEGLLTAPVVLIWWTADAYANRDPSIPADDVAAILADGASKVDPLTIPADGWVSGVRVIGSQLWPGAEVDAATQIGTAWPGWALADDGTWMLDPASPFYDLHAGAVIEVRMNPSSASTAAYPPTELGCYPKDPPTLPEPPDPPVPPVIPPMLALTGLNLFGGATVGLAMLGLGIAARRQRPRS